MTSTIASGRTGRWPELAVVGTGVLLAFAPWFSARRGRPLLAEEWQTTGLDLPLLTVAVQVGFAVAALGIAVTAPPTSSRVGCCSSRVR